MTRTVSGSYDRRDEAEAVRRHLQALGIPEQAITIDDRSADGPASEAGLFDRLADFLLAGRSRRPAAYLLHAAVSDDRFDAAARLVNGLSASDGVLLAPESGLALREQVHEFTETAEQLSVTKELFVREEVVLSKLIENHVRDIDGTVRRSEIEVERLSPEEAERIRREQAQPAGRIS